MQRILSHMRKAIEDYHMIEENDKIAICLSGGKDSITMLHAFKALQRFYPKKFDIRKEKNPCSLCANLRRGIINSIAVREGCNKIALGHNEDDVLETFLLNLFYTGSIGTFSPVSYMDRTGITLIRPLIYTSEKETKRFVKKNNLKVMPKVCPMDGTSKREDMKQMIFALQKDIPMIRANLYGAIRRNIPDWK